MTDFDEPSSSSAYINTPQLLKLRDLDCLTRCIVEPSNIPTGAIRYVRNDDKFQEYDGSDWVDLIISIAGGGTGASSSDDARITLGIGSLGLQSASSVDISGGILSGVSAVATIIHTGTIDPSRLGSGSLGTGKKFLSDNQTYKDGEPVGSGKFWFTEIAPTGYLICDGSLISRSTYSALFSLFGTFFGVGDGVSTFGLPNLVKRIPIGKTSSGTAGTFGAVFGSLDHKHTGPSHNHTYDDVPNHVHVITDSGHVHQVQHWTSGSPKGNPTDDPDLPAYFVDAQPNRNSSNATANLSASNPIGGVTQGTTANSGTGDTGTNNPPCLVVNYIVKY